MYRFYPVYSPRNFLYNNIIIIIPYSRVVKRTSLIVRHWFDSVIKIFFIKRTFIDIVPSNDTLESKRKLLFQLISDKYRTYFK